MACRRHKQTVQNLGSLYTYKLNKDLWGHNIKCLILIWKKHCNPLLQLRKTVWRVKGDYCSCQCRATLLPGPSKGVQAGSSIILSGRCGHSKSMSKRAGGFTTATLTLVSRPICTPQMPPATPRTKCFNQLHHPHSPGSRATKRLSSCPQRTVRLMCLSTLQGPGWAGRGRRQGEGK